MALVKMQQVAAEIRERWGKVEGIAIIQRIGTLGVGDNTVLCGCSSPHRDDGCFEAARYGIDRLKEIVPDLEKRGRRRRRNLDRRRLSPGIPATSACNSYLLWGQDLSSPAQGKSNLGAISSCARQITAQRLKT